jgi:hypothetical protein
MLGRALRDGLSSLWDRAAARLAALRFNPSRNQRLIATGSPAARSTETSHEAQNPAPRSPEEGQGQEPITISTRARESQTERASCRACPIFAIPSSRRHIRTRSRSGPRPRGAEGVKSFDWLCKLYERSPDFKKLAEASKQLYLLHLGYANENFRSSRRTQLAAVDHHCRACHRPARQVRRQAGKGQRCPEGARGALQVGREAGTALRQGKHRRGRGCAGDGRARAVASG